MHVSINEKRGSSTQDAKPATLLLMLNSRLLVFTVREAGFPNKPLDCTLMALNDDAYLCPNLICHQGEKR